MNLKIGRLLTPPESFTSLCTITLDNHNIGAYYLEDNEIWIEDTHVTVTRELRRALKVLIQERFGIQDVLTFKVPGKTYTRKAYTDRFGHHHPAKTITRLRTYLPVKRID